MSQDMLLLVGVPAAGVLISVLLIYRWGMQRKRVLIQQSMEQGEEVNASRMHMVLVSVSIFLTLLIGVELVYGYILYLNIQDVPGLWEQTSEVFITQVIPLLILSVIAKLVVARYFLYRATFDVILLSVMFPLLGILQANKKSSKASKKASRVFVGYITGIAIVARIGITGLIIGLELLP